MRTSHRTSRLFLALALGTGLIAGGAALAPALAQTSKSAPAAEARQVKSIPQIHDQLTALGYTNIDKIERDDNNFEVKANAKNGDRVKLYLDDQTGEILKKKQEQRNRDKASG